MTARSALAVATILATGVLVGCGSSHACAASAPRPAAPRPAAPRPAPRPAPPKVSLTKPTAPKPKPGVKPGAVKPSTGARPQPWSRGVPIPPHRPSPTYPRPGYWSFPGYNGIFSIGTFPVGYLGGC